jgi:hypothetical protein
MGNVLKLSPICFFQPCPKDLHFLPKSGGILAGFDSRFGRGTIASPRHRLSLDLRQRGEFALIKSDQAENLYGAAPYKCSGCPTREGALTPVVSCSSRAAPMPDSANPVESGALAGSPCVTAVHLVVWWLWLQNVDSRYMQRPCLAEPVEMLSPETAADQGQHLLKQVECTGQGERTFEEGRGERRGELTFRLCIISNKNRSVQYLLRITVIICYIHNYQDMGIYLGFDATESVRCRRDGSGPTVVKNRQYTAFEHNLPYRGSQCWLSPHNYLTRYMYASVLGVAAFNQHGTGTTVHPLTKKAGCIQLAVFINRSISSQALIRPELERAAGLPLMAATRLAAAPPPPLLSLTTSHSGS